MRRDKYHKTIRLAGMSVLLLFSTFTLSDINPPGHYTFGVVPQFDQGQIRLIWEPILKELGRRTGFHFKLIGSSSIPEFEKQYLNGKFDLVYMNPYFVFKATEQGYIPIVRDVGIDLQGVVVVRKDSPVHKVQQLTGKNVGFPSPNALGASLIPRADFRNRFRIDVFPVYLKTHSAVYRAVLAGKVAAGAGVQKSLERQPFEVRSRLRIIYRTRKFPSHPIIIHHRVPIADREKILDALLELASTEKGKLMQQKIPIGIMGITSTLDYKPISEWGLDKLYEKQ